MLSQRASHWAAWSFSAPASYSRPFRAAARGGHVVEQQLFAQHGIDRVGQGGALARAKSAVFAEETGHRRVGGVVKFKGEPDQFGAGFHQGFRMHKPLLSSPPHFNHV